jgi:rare lipoprotein A
MVKSLSFILISYPKIGLVFTLLLVLGLLNGCTSEPIVYNAPYEQVYHSPRHLSYHHKRHRHHKYRKHHLSHYHKRSGKQSYQVKGKTYHPLDSGKGYSETGIASWYGSESGSKTAMGTRFSPGGVSAAHKTLPLPSKVRVTNLHNGRSIVVVVNDRGPFKKGRIIDLSQGAARKIGMDGLAKVKVDYLGRAD